MSTESLGLQLTKKINFILKYIYITLTSNLFYALQGSVMIKKKGFRGGYFIKKCKDILEIKLPLFEGGTTHFQYIRLVELTIWL